MTWSTQSNRTRTPTYGQQSTARVGHQEWTTFNPIGTHILSSFLTVGVPYPAFSITCLSRVLVALYHHSERHHLPLENGSSSATGRRTLQTSWSRSAARPTHSSPSCHPWPWRGSGSPALSLPAPSPYSTLSAPSLQLTRQTSVDAFRRMVLFSTTNNSASIISCRT